MQPDAVEPSGDTSINFIRSIIIPARNEARRIGPTLDDYTNHFGPDTEIIVVLNQCEDDTGNVVASFKRPNLLVINEPWIRGKGGAVIEGIRRASANVVAFVDADGATSASELERLMGLLDDNDGIIGSRWIDPTILIRQQNCLRRLTSRVFNVLVRKLLRLPFRDTQCGAKVFRREAIAAIFGSLDTTNMAFDVELLYLLNKRGSRLVEVPTVWEAKPDSTIHMWVVAPAMLLAIFRIRWKHRAR
jgi:dolichol-phosphate mannosyltransferase